jgi:hypothetical protein
MKVFRRLVLLLPGCLLLLVLLTPSLAFAQPRTMAASFNQPTSTSCPVVPAHTDIMKLSDAELAVYGFPSHAAIQGNPTLWQYFADHTPHRVCKQGGPSHYYSPSAFPHGKIPYNIGDGCNATPSSRCEDGVWAGNLAISKGRGAYRIAQMNVSVPTISTSDPNAEVAFWTGVGGDGWITSSTVLVQSAIVISVVNGKEYVETDIEVANNVKAYQLPLCQTPQVNDRIYLYANSNVNNDGYDYFYIRDDNGNNGNGCSNSCYLGTNNSNPPTPHCPFNGGPSYNSDSASGECIAERVGGNELGFGGYDVAEFNPPGHQEQVTNCDINNVAIGSQAHNYMVLENGGAQLLIDVGPISNGTDFPFRWHQSS